MSFLKFINKASILEKYFKYLILGLVIFFGLIPRTYNLRKNVSFDWDQEKPCRTVLEMIRRKKPILIGPRIGPGKFFIAPFYYYAIVPFLFLAKLDPIGLYYAHVFFATITGILIFASTSQIFGFKKGLIALLIYNLSPYFITFDRSSFNASPMLVSSTLTFYSFYEIFVKKKKDIKFYFFLGLGISIGLSSHLSSIFLLFLFLLLFANKVVKKRIIKPKSLLPFLIIIISILPLVIFDLRHNFINLKYAIEFFSNTSQDKIPTLSFLQRLTRNLRISLQRPTAFFIKIENLTLSIIPGIAITVYVLIKSFFSCDKKLFRLIFFYLYLPVLFLSFFKGNIPTYYYFWQMPVLILVIVDLIFAPKVRLILPAAVIIVLTASSFSNFQEIKKENNRSLFYKQKVVEKVLTLARGNDFRINYVMDFGTSFGFNYFFELNNHIPRQDADLEIVIQEPYIPKQDPNKEYEKIGAYGIKINK